MSDPYDLNRFVQAQAGVYEQALAEIRAGRKQSHWMWFIFPQLAGLGASPMARRYAIGNLAEAEAYLGQLLLGTRLREISQAALGLSGRSAHDIFGSPDDLKLQSCATLFASVPAPHPVFDRLLAKYFAGQRDERTLRLLAQDPA